MDLFLLEILPVCIGMFYYVIWRFFFIFGNNSKLIPFIIATILACYVVLMFMYQWNNKILDILSTLSSWIFVSWFILFIILLIEHSISIWYKINPWITLWIIIIILATWTYCSLHTKIINLNIQSDKIQKDTKILLVSDIHVENITQDFHVNRILKAIEQEKPDFVIIAWDLMNKPNDTYVDYFSAFKSVKDTPIFAVKGNHDVMWNGTIVNEIPENSGIIFLNNAVMNNDSLNIQVAGTVDKSTWWNETINEVLDQIEFDNTKDWFTILITHQPIKLEKLKDYPIDLEVAWHTHHGQFYGIMELSRLANDYLYGEYKLWDRTAFVTQWIWTWGLPFRLWTQSEIVLINLTKK